jgi:hypothetical protein
VNSTKTGTFPSYGYWGGERAFQVSSRSLSNSITRAAITHFADDQALGHPFLT